MSNCNDSVVDYDSVIKSVKGKVKFFNRGSGFATIRVDSQLIDVFLHHAYIVASGFKTLTAGEFVIMDIKLNDNKKGLMATRIEQVSAQPCDTEELFVAA